MTRAFPSTLPTGLTDLPTLLNTLTMGFLLSEPAPLAWPEDVINALLRLNFFRLPGVSRTYSGAGLPHEVIAGLTSQKVPFAYIMFSDGAEVRVLVGSTPAHSPRLARTLSSVIGGPEPTPFDSSQHRFNWNHFSGISGHPRASITAEDSSSSGQVSMLDMLMDGADLTPFVYVTYATPEPRDMIRQRLDSYRQAAESVDRQHVQSGPQAGVIRDALRARDLLDSLANRHEAGLALGLWRTSVLVGADDQSLSDYLLGSLCGGLQKPPGEEVVVPLRGLRCGPRQAQDSGYPVHHSVLVSSELASLCPLGRQDRQGFRQVHTAAFDVDHPPQQAGLDLGKILSGPRLTSQSLTVSTPDLCRHALVVGMTGSGKSTTVRRLLMELAGTGRPTDVPFLVIEPAKAEYRQLASTIPALRTFRVGSVPNPGEAPFVFNPFYFPDGFRLHTHIDYLKQAFIASFGLFPPTPYLLESAIYRVYEQHGWNLGSGVHPGGRQRLSFPTLSDLLLQIDPIVEEAGYDSEIARNLKGALKTRIGNLCLGPKGAALDTRENIPEEHLFRTPVVLELKDLGSDEEKSLVMGLIITRLYEYCEAASPPQGGGLAHLMVIEEAHRLLKRTTERSSEESNMAHQSVQTFCNMLAEIRAYGEGVVIVEQLPSKLAADGIKNSGLKILHRLSPQEDRDLVGDTMVLDKEQNREAAVLAPGEAIVHAGGMDGAVRIKVPFGQINRSRGAGGPRPFSLDLQRRLDAVVRRVPFIPLLRSSDAQLAGSRFLLHLVADIETSQALAELYAALDTRDLPVTAGITRDEARRVAMVWLVEDALILRAIHHHWSDEDMANLVGLLNRDMNQFAGQYRQQLRKMDRQDRFCRKCPSPCLFGYEAHTNGRDAEYLEDLHSSLKQDDVQDIFPALGKAADRRLGRTFEVHGDQAPLLRFCLIREGLQHLELQNRTVGTVLEQVFARTQNQMKPDKADGSS